MRWAALRLLERKVINKSKDDSETGSESKSQGDINEEPLVINESCVTEILGVSS